MTLVFSLSHMYQVLGSLRPHNLYRVWCTWSAETACWVCCRYRWVRALVYQVHRHNIIMSCDNKQRRKQRNGIASMSSRTYVSYLVPGTIFREHSCYASCTRRVGLTLALSLTLSQSNAIKHWLALVPCVSCTRCDNHFLKYGRHAL